LWSFEAKVDRKKSTSANYEDSFFEKIYKECKDIIICPECGRIWMQENGNSYISYTKEHWPDEPAEDKRLSFIRNLKNCLSA